MCTRPVQAQARQNPSVEGGGAEWARDSEELLASDHCWDRDQFPSRSSIWGIDQGKSYPMSANTNRIPVLFCFVFKIEKEMKLCRELGKDDLGGTGTR